MLVLELIGGGRHWVIIHVKNDGVTYFDSFGIDHILI